jgi:dolichyl-phosphate beta-glucosyltransferase
VTTNSQVPSVPEFTLIIPVRRPPERFREHVRDIWGFFSKEGLLPAEIVLVPNNAARDREDLAQAWCDELSAELDCVRSVVHRGPCGKGAALKTGVQAARGRYILITDADLPYSLSFFVEAVRMLRSGVALVVGNRRREESWFEVPVPLLPYVYNRHRLSLVFNRAVRFLLPIPFTDTQAGIKAMSRELARLAFSRNICPGFFFDLELFLAAHGLGLSMADLPVHFTQHDEATTVRFLRSSISAIYWLMRIKLRHLLGYYRWAPVDWAPSPTQAALRTE